MGDDNVGVPRDAVSVLVALARAGGREVSSAEHALLEADRPVTEEQLVSLVEILDAATSRLDPARQVTLVAGLHRHGGTLAQVAEAHAAVTIEPGTLPPRPTGPPPPPPDAVALPDAVAQASEPSPDSPSARRRARRRRRTAVAVVVVVLAGAGALSWRNYRTGVRWQQVASAAQADAAELREANEQLADDLDQVTEALRRSEIDVSGLERRLSRVANEKARVEDEREQANAMTERITEIAVAYEDVAQWFQACRQDQTRLTQMALDLDAYVYAGQSYLVDAQVDAVVETCGTAEGRLADLRGYVDALATG